MNRLSILATIFVLILFGMGASLRSVPMPGVEYFIVDLYGNVHEVDPDENDQLSLSLDSFPIGASELSVSYFILGMTAKPIYMTIFKESRSSGMLYMVTPNEGDEIFFGDPKTIFVKKDGDTRPGGGNGNCFIQAIAP